MSDVIAAYINIAETGTVSLTVGAENASFPLYRVYDRDIGLLFKASAAATLEIFIDQGASSILATSILFIPSGHGLNGMTIDIQHSDDDIVYTNAVPQFVQGDALDIIKEWAQISKRYWKFIVTAPVSVPSLSELYISDKYTFERAPTRPSGMLDEVFNVENSSTSGGHDRFLEFGDPKKIRSYSFPNISEAQKDNLLLLNAEWAGGKPFIIKDHTGQWIFGKLDAPLSITEIQFERYSAQFSFLEVLP
ncbi:MAG: hypothetical protein KAV87_17015 [Desulfobacteraceae bacterium]|nr:hypothetical protein [Desulfobacteraceae bacterium]